MGLDHDGRPILGMFRTASSKQLPAMERVAAINLGDGLAVPFELLRQRQVVNTRLAGTPLTVFWNDAASTIAAAADRVGSVEEKRSVVYDRRVEGLVLTFYPVEGGFRDRETGTGWTVAGRAVEGELTGRRLRPVRHGNHFWFAWAVFKPGTDVWRP